MHQLSWWWYTSHRPNRWDQRPLTAAAWDHRSCVWGCHGVTIWKAMEVHYFPTNSSIYIYTYKICIIHMYYTYVLYICIYYIYYTYVYIHMYMYIHLSLSMLYTNTIDAICNLSSGFFFNRGHQVRTEILIEKRRFWFFVPWLGVWPFEERDVSIYIYIYTLW